jgi:hypothetical protein
MQKAEPPRRIKRINSGLPRQALLKGPPLGRVLDSVADVVADLLYGFAECLRAEGK